MYFVKLIRKDDYHYLSVPDEILSWVKTDRILKFGHALPSLVTALLLGVKIIPLISNTYAEHLKNNGIIILLTVTGILVLLLIINGIIIELILERYNTEYKEYKRETNANTKIKPH
jgi:hypothetical protein